MLTDYIKRLQHARGYYRYSYPYLVVTDLWYRDWKKSNPTAAGKAFPFLAKTPWDGWYMHLADRAYKQATYYKCVNGTCVVIWHKTRGNMGGSGPAGCSCDEMDDPRGEKID